MTSTVKRLSSLVSRSRRQFLKSLVHTGVLIATLPYIKNAKAQAIPLLGGTEFDLTIAETKIVIAGIEKIATTINGTMPGPTLYWKEGDTVTLRVKNLLSEETSLHWHGIILPYQMDGAPQISFNGIAPGETFTYHFKVQQSGTYWYHSHSEMQEQTGLYGAIIIEPATIDAIQADRDYVVLLSDWTDEDPMTVFANLKKHSAYYNYNQPTVVDFFRDIAGEGVKSALEKRHMWNMMRMSRADLADISAATYRYLVNGHDSTDNWLGVFKPGERVRLRFINASAQTFFDVRIPGLALCVEQADGQNIEPVLVDEFRIGLAETYDVIVTPTQTAYTIFAQAMDRTGYVRGTLATHAGLSARVPEMDKPELLTMGDMMGAMNHDMAAMDHSAMTSEQMRQMGHDMADMRPVSVHHASTEFSASVDMRVDTPRTNLDDPGIGLRNNGRRVLTYADLHTVGGTLDARAPTRDMELHLTGNMERYTWSFDGVAYNESTPIHFRYGERLRVILVNDTMMTHPVHLHGMWSELETADGQFQVRKHTIVVQPAQRVSFLVTADALGRWPWHCHLFYHMHAGMFREVVVS
ncbi:copper resistance system multicopper oxidase [Crenothrix polyspora]|uniref:Copper resistance protein A n=1 Tax=Crenothrix polyspora TaxID=360316 RepID=A0A1R4H842_9GAMM|nr:copper resistance system multicopper oxidase [Crenothrix polyspora]SJM92337.1 Copper resistance protein A [Crenothrix polyspora]